LALKVERFERDALFASAPLLGNCRIPLSHLSLLRLSPMPPTNAMQAYRDWQLEYAPEPVLPETGGESSPLLHKPAPPITLPLLGGGQFDLNAEKGKVVILDFWATWCGPCVASMPENLKVIGQFDPNKVKFVAVNQGEPDAQVSKFLQTRGWQMVVAMDATQAVGAKYGADSIPLTVIIGPDGKVEWTHSGFSAGGAEKMVYGEVPSPAPGADEVRFTVEAAGVNFIDTYQRSGLYPVKLPHTLGMEAAGVVTAVGAGVTEFKVGDRVASARTAGAYAQEALAPAAFTVRLPESITTAVAAALMLQGMTAHYLACDTWPLKSGDTVLVHAAAGGVGLLLVQMAKLRGARVLATVGTDDKAKLASEAGADAVCVYSRENFSEAARAFTGGRGVDVVYDGVGKDTFEGSLASLRPRGLLASFGNASGPVPPVSPLVLSQKGSLFLTRPTLAHYTLTTTELRARTDDLFAWIAQGKLKVRIGATYSLLAAADAHRALEGRATTGKVLLLP
jgi:NADPH2:quinone reductase